MTTIRNIHAVGRNYVAHIEELGNEIPGEPVIFSKSPSCLTSRTNLRFPNHAVPVHFELELVLRMGRNLEVGDFQSLDCISHMALGIDFTAREWQSRLKEKGLPWHLAKNFENACFMGPQRPYREGPFLFRLLQNNQLRQEGDSNLMIYNFQTILAYLNRTLPLCEGDLIFTGTPAGVGPTISGDRLRIICEALDTDLVLTIE